MPHQTNSKIIFILGKFPGCGGVEKVTSDLSKALAKESYEVAICSFFRDNSASDSFLFQEGENVSHVQLQKPVFSSINLRLLLSALTINQRTIIINQWCLSPSLSLILICLKLFRNFRVISCHHNDPIVNKKTIKYRDSIAKSSGLGKLTPLFLYHFSNLLTFLTLRFCLCYTDKFVVLSQSFVPRVARFLRLRSYSSLLAIPNPVTTNNSLSFDEIHQSKQNVLTFVGRIDDNQKRIYRIIDFWKHFYKKYPDWICYIIGDGPLLENVKQYSKSDNIPNIFFTGFVEPAKYFQLSKINLLLSEWEGFGLVNVEAMSYGSVPVCLNSYLAASDIITNGQNGILLKYPYKLSSAIENVSELIDNPELLRQMSLNGYISRRYYDMDNILKLWSDLLQNLEQKS